MALSTVLLITLLSSFTLIWSITPSTLSIITESTKDGAACLDGSPPAYYFHQGSGSGANKWFLHHQGGGCCGSLQDCYARSLTGLGSSKSYGKTADLGGGYFSTDPKVNPLMYNWNMVLFMYCDGAFFGGHNQTVSSVNGHNIYFRGYPGVKILTILSIVQDKS